MSIYSLIASFILIILAGAIVHANESPQLVDVGMVSPRIVSFTVLAGRVEHGHQIPYHQQAGDKIEDHNHHRWVKRDDKFIGALVGAEGKILHTLDILKGEKFDTAWADRAASYCETI